MPSTNFSDGLVLDSTLRFHTASAASHAPGRRPTRGSGLGSDAETLVAGVAAVERDMVEGVHAAANTIAANAGQRDAARNMRGMWFCWMDMMWNSSRTG
jgi:hypothetical protein